jgi:hypothetical protein
MTVKYQEKIAKMGDGEKRKELVNELRALQKKRMKNVLRRIRKAGLHIETNELWHGCHIRKEPHPAAASVTVRWIFSDELASVHMDGWKQDTGELRKWAKVLWLAADLCDAANPDYDGD